MFNSIKNFFQKKNEQKKLVSSEPLLPRRASPTRTSRTTPFHYEEPVLDVSDTIDDSAFIIMAALATSEVVSQPCSDNSMSSSSNSRSSSYDSGSSYDSSSSCDSGSSFSSD